MLLFQLPALYSRVSARGTQATGVPDVLRACEDQLVSGWIARCLLDDPTLFLLLSEEAGVLNGAVIAQLVGRTVDCWHVSSPSPPSSWPMYTAFLQWARSTGASQIVGVTFHNPRVWRRYGFQSLRDQFILEMSDSTQ